MTKNEAIAELKKLAECKDVEEAHVKADSIVFAFLRTNGNKEIVEEWEKVDRKLGFWYA